MNLQSKLEKGLYDPGSIEKKPLCSIKYGTAIFNKYYWATADTKEK